MLDSYSIAELEALVADSQRVNFYSALSAEVSAGQLTFPEAVLLECRTLGAGESATVWLVSVSGSRMHASFPGATPMQVLAKVPDLLADDDSGEQAHVAVACLAAAKNDAELEPVVVTEDPGFGGDRITLAEACDVLAIPCIDVRSYVDTLGLSGCLT